MDNNQCVEKILIDREHRFWKNTKSVHDQIRISVHDEPELVFTMLQNQCSRWARICTILQFVGTDAFVFT